MQLKKLVLTLTSILSLLHAQESEKKEFKSEFTEDTILYFILSIDTMSYDKEKILQSLSPETVCILIKMFTTSYPALNPKLAYDALHYVNHNRPDLVLKALEHIILKKVSYYKFHVITEIGIDLDAQIPDRTYSIQQLLEAQFGVRIIEGVEAKCTGWRRLFPTQECNELKNCLNRAKKVRTMKVMFHKKADNAAL